MNAGKHAGSHVLGAARAAGTIDSTEATQLGPAEVWGRQGLQGEAGPTQARSAPDLSQRASVGQGAASWNPAARLTNPPPPCQRGPQSCLCVAAGRGLGGCWQACLELTSCPPEGHRDEGGPWGGRGDQPPWLLLLYILCHPGQFLLKWLEMRTWIAQQMPSSVVGPGSSVRRRMRTGRWALWTWGTGTRQGRCHRAPIPRAQGRCWLKEDLPRSLATGSGPCTCQHGSAQNSTGTAVGSKPAPRL